MDTRSFSFIRISLKPHFCSTVPLVPCELAAPNSLNNNAHRKKLGALAWLFVAPQRPGRTHNSPFIRLQRSLGRGSLLLPHHRITPGTYVFASPQQVHSDTREGPSLRVRRGGKIRFSYCPFGDSPWDARSASSLHVGLFFSFCSFFVTPLLRFDDEEKDRAAGQRACAHIFGRTFTESDPTRCGRSPFINGTACWASYSRGCALVMSLCVRPWPFIRYFCAPHPLSPSFRLR